ncbi:helix-turn-helix transcriptional regulator [Sphaerisporangium sp. NPDC051017]|uniref:helix-turn-helix domain-containing protein n=1 Tax=unclassified Sphaerisporangium TaxID=2630420 RepID=UPI0033DD28AC
MPKSVELNPEDSPRALFAFELRRYRKAAGLSQEQLGGRIGFSVPLISAVETARRPPTREFAVAVDEALELEGALIRLWPFAYHSATPTWFRPWLELEREATVLHAWQPLVVPGLLQTEDYARAIFLGEPRPTSDVVEEQVAARMVRQKIFDRPEPPMYWVILDEGVLHRVVGSPETLIGQLRRLEELARTPHITIHILPYSSYVTAGLEGGFVMAQIPGGADTVYIEAVGSGQLVERVEEVRLHRMRYEMLRAEALPGRSSIERIREIREVHESQRRTQDSELD